MDRFSVYVNRGIVTNSKNDTARIGYWIPLRSLPRHAASRLGVDRDTGRETLSYDLSNGWRDMRNASVESTRVCTATIVTRDDGTVGIALLDY